jgi:hypothetical protein
MKKEKVNEEKNWHLNNLFLFFLTFSSVQIHSYFRISVCIIVTEFQNVFELLKKFTFHRLLLLSPCSIDKYGPSSWQEMDAKPMHWL